MSATGPAGFAEELGQLDIPAEVLAGRFVVFSYEVDVGPLDGTVLHVALEPTDHPRTPPTGPFVSPRLLPIRPEGSKAPYDGVHEAAGRGFPDPDGVWEYWSRPFNEWAEWGRTARSYLEIHLRRLFAGLPGELAERCAA